ncbi:class I SAM-dependent methyltransferase [Clostridium sp.]|uniref:class I SAM-dependent methyltransferase n=1 Tax=Clostridium sp. TaxID=1506 RepID=UPI002FCA2A98
MNYDELIESWKKEEEYVFVGWNFSHLKDRVKIEPLPWKYKQVIKSYMDNKKIMLDMGTGGGEFLLSLNPTPGNTFATEGYPPNVKLSTVNLSPFGIEVRQVYEDTALPFPDETFDIIINRHEYFCPKEVKRILKPQGVFITQQVGGRNNKELSKFLLGDYPNIISFDFNLETNLKGIEAASLKVLQKAEFFPISRYYDIGALVYYCKIIQWEFPDFSVERCLEPLLKLQKNLEETGYIESVEHRFFIVAKKE